MIALGSLLATVPEPFIWPPAAALSLLVATVVWTFWVLDAAAVGAVRTTALIISVALLSFTVIYPDSFLQFVPLLPVLGIGSLISLIAGTRAFASYRRGHAALVSPKMARWWLRTAVVAVSALWCQRPASDESDLRGPQATVVPGKKYLVQRRPTIRDLRGDGAAEVGPETIHPTLKPRGN